MREALELSAKDIASKATGMRPDEIEAAVKAYRDAANSLHAEPRWQALSHFCGRNDSFASYVDADAVTQVAMSVNSYRLGEETGWKQEKTYSVHGKTYETYGEARAAELKGLTKFTPRAVP